MRLALVTEASPPEVNGLTNQGYQVQVVRPFQPSDGNDKGERDGRELGACHSGIQTIS